MGTKLITLEIAGGDQFCTAPGSTKRTHIQCCSFAVPFVFYNRRYVDEGATIVPIERTLNSNFEDVYSLGLIEYAKCLLTKSKLFFQRSGRLE